MKFKKGCTPWNKNLTKEVDERLRYNSKAHIMETRVCDCPDHEEFVCKKSSKQRYIGGHWVKGKEYLNKGRHRSKETKEKMKRASLKRWQDPEYREMQVEIALKNWQDPDFREKQSKAASKAALKKWQDPVYAERMNKIHQGARCKERMSKAMLQHWKDPEYARRMLKAFRIKPNRAEQEIMELLQEICLYNFAYNQRAQCLTLGGKIPDFVNVNGQKKLIEFYGNYWHSKKRTDRSRGEEELQRINYFKKYGYETLIVWENELKDERKLKERILNFVGEVQEVPLD